MNVDDLLTKIQEEGLEIDDAVNIVVASVSEEYCLNCKKLNEIINKLRVIKKTAEAEWEEYCRIEEKSTEEERYVAGKAYFDKIEVGSSIKFRLKTGEIVEGKIGSKQRKAKTAHIIFEGKNRYIKFYNIIPE